MVNDVKSFNRFACNLVNEDKILMDDVVKFDLKCFHVACRG